MGVINRPTSRRKIINSINSLIGLLTTTTAGVAGKTFYVDSTSARASDTATNGGVSTSPFATIAYAITQAVASRGDTIVCAPGHVESISDVAAIALSKAGVSLIGRGEGSLRPTLTWGGAATSTLTITAAGCRISNFIFDMSLPSALVSGIVVSASSCRIDNCLFKIGTAGTGTRPLQAVLTTAAADYFTVEDCQFLEPTATPTTVSAASCAIKLVGGVGIRIRRNVFIGWYTTTVGAITSITTLNGGIEITNNHIVNQTTSSTKGVVLLTGSTGIVANNAFGVLSGAAPITGDAVWWMRNWSAAAVATNGTLV